MLHPINLPNCSDALWTVVIIQEELLKLAYINRINTASLRSRFEAKTVNWLMKHHQKLLEPLNEFYAHRDLSEKKAILDAFRHDITYHENLEDPNFTFQLQPKSSIPSPLAIKVGEWLENFYDIMAKSGVPAAVTGYHTTINQQLILNEFNRINIHC